VKALKGIDLDLYSIDFEDQNVYQLLYEAKTLGIFQFESIGMQGMLRRIQPSKLEDLSIVSAIYRPGPLQFANILIENKRNPSKIQYLHPSLKSILEETYGIILYQEQIINIAQKIASFNETESDLFRKAISKKDEQKIIGLKNNFISGALKNGYSQEIADSIFKQMLDFASYGFNHSHSISYALISYFLAYLKYYYPLETFTVLLSNLSDKNKLGDYKKEALELNIVLRTPNINLSSTNFILRGNEIFFAFNAINGIGEEIAKKIITLRELQENKKFDYPEQAIFLLSKAKISKKSIDSLILSGVFDDFNLGREYLIKAADIIINSKSILMDNLLEQTKKMRIELGCDVNTENYA
ncbi:MAG: DNA polymerase III subunit alpha, partial [Ureaplasma sp.]|nr:DNA polymerase III subunit alpha [Ureaplasma sp.]